MPDPLTTAQIDAALADLPGWSFADDALHRDYAFHSFKEAMGFITRIAFEAEAMQHHPTITNTYNKVGVALDTHDAGGKVTQKDVDLAREIERINWT